MKLGFFYKKLYSSSDTHERANLQHLFSNYDSPVLSNLTRDRLEGPLAYQEVLNALGNYNFLVQK